MKLQKRLFRLSAEALLRQRRAVFALMLRNVRTRFFGHGLGYLIAIGWPIAHILILILIFSYSGRVAPYGESAVLFIATGTVPYMVFSYLSRFMMLSTITTKPLVVFPDVKILDVLFSSAILEVLTSCLVVIILLILALISGVDFWPRDLVDASLALLASVLLGIGFGLFNGVIAFAIPFWHTVYALINILLWLSSGVAFVASNLPDKLRVIACYLPTLQIVEWMRTSYYDDYSIQILDRAYAIKFAVITILGGLLLERAMRGYLMFKR